MSLYQLCILMQFNDTATLTLDALRGACEIPEQEFKRHLLSLCTPKLRILKKHSKGKVSAQVHAWHDSSSFSWSIALICL